MDLLALSEGTSSWEHGMLFEDCRYCAVRYCSARWKDNDILNQRIIQGDSKRLTQFRTSIFPELYLVCE